MRSSPFHLDLPYAYQNWNVQFCLQNYFSFVFETTIRENTFVCFFVIKEQR